MCSVCQHVHPVGLPCDLNIPRFPGHEMARLVVDYNYRVFQLEQMMMAMAQNIEQLCQDHGIEPGIRVTIAPDSGEQAAPAARSPAPSPVPIQALPEPKGVGRDRRTAHTFGQDDRQGGTDDAAAAEPSEAG